MNVDVVQPNARATVLLSHKRGALLALVLPPGKSGWGISQKIWGFEIYVGIPENLVVLISMIPT